MPKSEWRDGKFAVGLIVGVCLTLIIFCYSNFLYTRLDQAPRTASHTQRQDDTGQSHIQDDSTWWHWNGGLVSSSDTLAQWIMTLFTILGAGLLYGTLRSANETNKAAIVAAKAASDANEIMREEQRPWLVFSGPFDPYMRLARIHRGFPPEALKVVVVNKGRRPAHRAVATYAIFSGDAISPEAVCDEVERILFGSADPGILQNTAVFQGETGHLPIVPLPRGQRVFGQGGDWHLMVVCFYYWGDKRKSIWGTCKTRKPPENVIKRR